MTATKKRPSKQFGQQKNRKSVKNIPEMSQSLMGDVFERHALKKYI